MIGLKFLISFVVSLVSAALYRTIAPSEFDLSVSTAVSEDEGSPRGAAEAGLTRSGASRTLSAATRCRERRGSLRPLLCSAEVASWERDIRIKDLRRAMEVGKAGAGAGARAGAAAGCRCRTW